MLAFVRLEFKNPDSAKGFECDLGSLNFSTSQKLALKK